MLSGKCEFVLTYDKESVCINCEKEVVQPIFRFCVPHGPKNEQSEDGFNMQRYRYEKFSKLTKNVWYVLNDQVRKEILIWLLIAKHYLGSFAKIFGPLIALEIINGQMTIHPKPKVVRKLFNDLSGDMLANRYAQKGISRIIF